MSEDDVAKILGESKIPVSPDRIPPSLFKIHPGPWQVVERGNGHVDLYDSERIYVAHVYLWDETDCDRLLELIKLSKA